MNNQNINIKLLNENAIIPTYGSEFSAGADLYSIEDAEIKPNETKMIHTGISLEIPNGLVGLIYARSGLGIKKGLAPANKVGVIDSDYRGEIIVALHNHGTETQTINAKDRIAQMVFAPYIKGRFNKVDELNETVRGTGGFGSTGKN